MSKRAALVAGATGLVGGHCLDVLLADPGYAAVHTVGRRPSGRQSPKLTDHIVDFANLANLANLDVSVFCCLGTTMRRAGSREAFRRVDLEYPLALAHAARDLGAGCFAVVSSLGADSGGATFYARVKGELEQRLRAVGFPSLVIARPSLLLGDRAEFRAGERVAAVLGRAVAPLLVGGLRRYRPIHAGVVARALVRLADERPAGVRVAESDELAELGAAA